MRRQHTWGRRTFTALLASGVAIGAATATGATAADAEPATGPAAPATEAPTPKDPPADTLGSHDAELLAEAKSTGRPNVTLIISTDDGAARDVAAQVEKLGGTVTRRFDTVGYVLAQVPTAKVVRTANLPGVAAVDLDETIEAPDPVAEARSGVVSVQQAPAAAAPGTGTPAVNPYLPTNDIGSVDFKTKNPTWDGRGVTIGIMDSGVDLDHPALQKTTTGARKIVDWVTATDPVLEGDLTWRRMVTAVTGPTFTVPNVPGTWTAPAGTFRFSRFSESITGGSDPGGDVNRDGDKTDTFGILYDPESHDIRVDSDQDLDFTDNAVMRPYREKFDVGHFGVDNPATAVVERIPFVVEFREDVDLTPVGLEGVADYVNIGIPESAHGSHVAGITAANDLFGNAPFDGQAPGAKLVSARACSWGGGCTAAALTTGMVDLVVNRRVDVVNMSIGGLPALNDGNNARARLYDKLINDYGVQIFLSAGNNGPGLNTIGDPAVSTNAVSVAASITKETWLSNYGSVVAKPNALFNFSSRGPREDGGLKPNITAPGSAVSTINTWLAGQGPVEAGYALPPGYAMFNGTSMAAPQAAGGTALLLSAAKATDRGITPAALRRALFTSAKWLASTPVYGQGNGLMDVNGAWALLANKVEARRYTSSAPVCTPLSDRLATKHSGVGIYNRCAAGAGGQKVGESRKYPVRLTRTSGPNAAVKHNLVWRGAYGAFTSAGSVVLPLNKTVSVEVTVKAAAGANSGILRVDDPATSVVDFEVLNTVVTAVAPGKPGYAMNVEGSVARNSYTSYFVTVPAGATALQVDLSGIATGSQVRWIAINPWGLPAESTSSLNCFTNYSDQAACKPQERAYENPIPGVWELEVEARRTSPALDNPFELTARVQGVTVSPDVVTLASVTAGTPIPVSWTVRNLFGPVTVAAQGGPLGSSVTRRPSIADGETQTYTVDVPAGASRFDVSIGDVSDTASDLDLTVLLGDEEVAQSADGDSEESVSIPNPAAGTYTVVVDGFDVPSGATEYDYRDVFFSPTLGRIAVPPAQRTLVNGASMTVAGTVTAAPAPPAGRNLFGELVVVTDQGAVVGRGTVRIGAVR